MERREHERLPVRQGQAQSGDHSLPYRVMNVSKTGCFLETRQPLGEVESAIEFELPLPAGADRRGDGNDEQLMTRLRESLEGLMRESRAWKPQGELT